MQIVQTDCRQKSGLSRLEFAAAMLLLTALLAVVSLECDRQRAKVVVTQAAQQLRHIRDSEVLHVLAGTMGQRFVQCSLLRPNDRGDVRLQDTLQYDGSMRAGWDVLGVRPRAESFAFGVATTRQFRTAIVYGYADLSPYFFPFSLWREVPGVVGARNGSDAQRLRCAPLLSKLDQRFLGKQQEIMKRCQATVSKTQDWRERQFVATQEFFEKQRHAVVEGFDLAEKIAAVDVELEKAVAEVSADHAAQVEAQQLTSQQEILALENANREGALLLEKKVAQLERRLAQLRASETSSALLKAQDVQRQLQQRQEERQQLLDSLQGLLEKKRLDLSLALKRGEVASRERYNALLRSVPARKKAVESDLQDLLSGLKFAMSKQVAEIEKTAAEEMAEVLDSCQGERRKVEELRQKEEQGILEECRLKEVRGEKKERRGLKVDPSTPSDRSYFLQTTLRLEEVLLLNGDAPRISWRNPYLFRLAPRFETETPKR